jgi:cytochrome P450
MGVVGKVLFDSDTFDAADELGDALTVALKWVDRNAASPALVAQVALVVALERLGPRTPGALRGAHADLSARLRAPVLLLGARDPELRRAVARIAARIQAMIDERRARPGARSDLLARLLTARDADDGAFAGMSDQQVRDEVTTLFVAGHETTATALAWTFYLLARNPDARARVQAEVDALPDGPIAFAAAARLGYTLRVFKESMRLYPPVEILARRSMVATEVGGVPVPRDTLLFMSPYTVHHSASVFPDPERFDPDRFLPEREAARPRCAYVPFGAGPRVCVGNHFALLEGPIVLATLMRHATFEIDPHRTIEPEAIATLRPKGGVPATVRLRRAAS